MIVQLIANGNIAPQWRERSPDSPLCLAAVAEHPDFFDKKASHAAHNEEDNHLIPATFILSKHAESSAGAGFDLENVADAAPEVSVRWR